MSFIKLKPLGTRAEEVVINTNYILYILQINTVNSQIVMRDGTIISVEESVNDVEFLINSSDKED